MTTHYLKQCRPDAEEIAYFWKLYHAAQRVEDRWCRNTVPDIAEALSYCSELSREQKLFLLRAWQVLVDDKGGFGRFMGAFDCYVHNVQDPTDNCVAYKPELKRHIEKGYLFDTVEESYNEARQRIAELETRPLCVKLPKAYAIRKGYPINETERFVMIPKESGSWFSRFDVEHALRIASVKFEEGQ